MTSTYYFILFYFICSTAKKCITPEDRQATRIWYRRQHREGYYLYNNDPQRLKTL